MRRTSLLPLVLVPMLVGCGSGASKTPHQAGGLVSIAGESEPSQRQPDRGRTTARLPKKTLTVPGRFPLGSVVRFYIPFRNNGREPLVVRSIKGLSQLLREAGRLRSTA